MIALISDLHANIEAVDAVFQDIDTQSVDAVVCLGDTVGYGASPADVMRKVQERCAMTLLGNHDAAVLDDRQAYGFHERALLAVDWTRRALDPEVESNHALWDWLGELKPKGVFESDAIRFQMVHASPREPLSEYLLPNMPSSSERLLANFEAAQERVTFYGHTHHPGAFQEARPFAKPDFTGRNEAGF
ncbi:MAG: metallophosphoesterase, partial [Planctomycetes bacterium]|nr:metallophosphoesterase [Planctomycetota bacterium]